MPQGSREQKKTTADFGSSRRKDVGLGLERERRPRESKGTASRKGLEIRPFFGVFKKNSKNLLRT